MFPGESSCIFNAPMSVCPLQVFTYGPLHFNSFTSVAFFKRYLITGTHAARRVQTDLKENSRVMHVAEFWAQQG